MYYVGGVVADVDECVSDVHDCDSVQFCHYAFTRGKLECIHASSCTNIHGGYLCSCKTGFTGDGITCQGTVTYINSYIIILLAIDKAYYIHL